MTSGVKDGRSEETSTMSAGTSTSVLDNVGTSLLDNPGMSILDREASNTSPMLDTGASNISIKSYETMMLETHKNATTYSLVNIYNNILAEIIVIHVHRNPISKQTRKLTKNASIISP